MEKNEPMILNVVYSSPTEHSKTNLRVTIRNENDISVCTAVCNKHFNTVIGENKYTFSLNMKDLCPGEYSANIALFDTNEYGTIVEFDSVLDAFYFSIRYQTDMEWNKTIFGDIRMGNLELE